MENNQLVIQNQALQKSTGLTTNKTQKEINKLYSLNSEKTKLRDNNENAELSLIESLDAISFDFGIRKPVDVLLKTKIAEALIDSFSDFTVEEVKHCAYLYSTNELEYEKEHYGELSVRFLSGALVSYRKKRTKALHKIQKEKEKTEREEANKDVREYKPDPRFTEYYLMRAEMSMVYNKALETGKKVNIKERYASNFFRHLMLRGVLTLSPAFINEWRQKGYDDLSKSFKSNERLEKAFTKMQYGKEIYNVDELKFKELIQDRSAKLFLDEYLTEKAKNKEVFSEFFKDFEA